jgi:hypothetical protein
MSRGQRTPRTYRGSPPSRQPDARVGANLPTQPRDPRRHQEVGSFSPRPSAPLLCYREAAASHSLRCRSCGTIGDARRTRRLGWPLARPHFGWLLDSNEDLLLPGTTISVSDSRSRRSYSASCVPGRLRITVRNDRPIHGPYRLDAITVQAFDIVNAATAKRLFTTWIDQIGASPERPDDLRQLWSSFDAASHVFRLRKLTSDSKHEWGWGAGMTGFHGFVLMSPAPQVALVVGIRRLARLCRPGAQPRSGRCVAGSAPSRSGCPQ